MAAASEATLIYNTRIVPSYVSSSGYYGYVPPINELTEHHNNYQHIELHNHHQQQQHQQSVRLSSERQDHHNHEHNGYNNSSAMETDGDETYINCQNNHCVIPETARRLANGCGGGVSHPFYRVATNNDNNEQMLTISRRGNRKRNSYDDVDEHHYGVLGNMKKLRKGGGNSRVCHGTRSKREYGSTAMHNESSTLCLVSNKTNSPLCFTSKAIDCCTDAAGNYDLLTAAGRQINRATQGCSIKSLYPTIDYEAMLMETHGCTAYHHHRNQLLEIGTIETEF